MEIMDIIKEAFVFPSKNLEKLGIYIALLFVVSLLIGGGALFSVLSSFNAAYLAIIGLVMMIFGIVLSLVISGYQVGVLKSGIDHADDAPSFDWKNDSLTGIKLLVVTVVYFIIPAIVVFITGLATNLPGNLATVFAQASMVPANSTGFALEAVSKSAMVSFGTSIAITSVVAMVLFIIFAFLHTMGESRLANTGSLGEALNIPEAFRDIKRIGAGKVIATVLMIFIVVAVISGIISYISGQIPQLSIISIIVTPYLAFFTQRAVGLLYSDIA